MLNITYTSFSVTESCNKTVSMIAHYGGSLKQASSSDVVLPLLVIIIVVIILIVIKNKNRTSQPLPSSCQYPKTAMVIESSINSILSKLHPAAVERWNGSMKLLPGMPRQFTQQKLEPQPPEFPKSKYIYDTFMLNFPIIYGE